ncbi:MAG: hypothetical protein AMXMBFR33_70110 [Candidatus Xenobia bacterium]
MNVQMLSAPALARIPRKAASSKNQPAPTPAPARGTPGPVSNRRLESNPLFREGVNYDEFPLTTGNIDFAARQFGLDPAFVDLARSSEMKDIRLSVVYHSDANQGLVVDALRAAAPAGPGSVFSVYDVKNADFDPNAVYRNELMTPLGNNRYFGTMIVSKRLAVPTTADPNMTKWLTDNGFEAKETLPVGEMLLPAPFKQAFGLPDELGVQMFDFRKKSFAEKFNVFYDLFKESPEYRALKVGDVLDEVGAAMVLGVITPELWKQGTAYGIASTISSIGNIGSPAVGILGESMLGSVVDNAVNSDRPVESLKKIGLATAGARAVRVGCTLGLHPKLISMMGPSPGTAFIGLYSSMAVIGALTGVVSGKADLAVRDQLINKSNLKGAAEYSKNFYQILGVEASISRALYLGSYSATVAAVSAFPAASLPIAAAGAALWGASSFVWPLYREKPEARATIEGGAYVRQGDRYLFDSGWEVTFSGGKGKIVREDDQTFSVSVDSGDLTIKNDQAVSMSHTRRLKDYLPSALKPKMLGEKERWSLSDGNDQVVISRYGNSGYGVRQVNDHEFVLSRPNP